MTIKPRIENTWEETVRLREAVGRVGTGVDILVYSEQEVERRGQVPGRVIYWALRKGKVVYEAPQRLRFLKMGHCHTCLGRRYCRTSEARVTVHILHLVIAPFPFWGTNRRHQRYSGNACGHRETSLTLAKSTKRGARFPRFLSRHPCADVASPLKQLDCILRQCRIQSHPRDKCLCLPFWHNCFLAIRSSYRQCAYRKFLFSFAHQGRDGHL